MKKKTVYRIILVCFVIVFPLSGCENNRKNVSKRKVKMARQKVIYGEKYSNNNRNITVKKIKDKLKIKESESEDSFSIAIIDSGIFLHKNLKDMLSYFEDYVNNRNKPYDDSGHGTAVSSIINDMDPNVNLVVLKVLNQDDKGEKQNIIKALEWVIQNNNRYKIKIVNISIGLFGLNQEDEIKVVKVCRELINKGIVIVTSSGNFQYYLRENELANIDGVISVGSFINKDNKIKMANYSQCWINKNSIVPTVCTYGDNILTLKSDVFYKGNSEEKIGNKKMYDSVSGTSFSTAIVSGYICNLFEQNNNIKLKEILKNIKSGKTLYIEKLQRSTHILGE